MLDIITRKLKYQHLLVAIALIIIAMFAVVWQQNKQDNQILEDASISNTAVADANISDVTSILDDASTLETKTSPKIIPKSFAWKTINIKSGDTASVIFSRLGLSFTDLENILKINTAKKYLTRLKVGQSLKVKIANKSHQLNQLKFAFDDRSMLIIKREAEKFVAKVNTDPLISRLAYKSFTVEGSLAASARNAGLSQNLYAQLGKVFANGINFRRDIHPGDHFDIMYQEYYLNGEKYQPGNIMLASYAGNKKHLTAIRYTDPHGKSNYYTPDGKGLAAAALFLSSPLSYSRISSHFTLHRMDPYLHHIHPHLGIDYAAPRGTPIHSIADGTISYRGWYAGYGNTIIVKYSQKYKALYGHMQHFASNLRPGSHIKKGQVIGYVGSTGWSTGPHLHFGWYVNGIACDPLKYKPTPVVATLPAQYRHSFLAESRSLFDQMQLYKTHFAQNKPLQADNQDRT